MSTFNFILIIILICLLIYLISKGIRIIYLITQNPISLSDKDLRSRIIIKTKFKKFGIKL